MTPFNDRREAGRRLAAELTAHGNDSLVLGLPRGGVPVAFEVARALSAPLDVLVVRKLGAPGQPELAMGAIASGGGRVVNNNVVRQLGVSDDTLEAAVAEEREELTRRQLSYRGTDAPADVAGRSVILVDDGLATGASMRAALKGVRELGAAHVTVAASVGATDTCAWLENAADALVCVATPEPFLGVGRWYTNFPQTSDHEVCDLLGRTASS